MQHEVEPWFLFAIFAIVCLVVLLDIRMGGKISKTLTDTHVPSTRPSASSTWGDYGNKSSGYSREHSYHTPQHQPLLATAPPYGYASQTPKSSRRLERKYSRIADDYYSLDEVTSALSHAGLESSNLIIGIDFTKSNDWTGARSFNRKSLHHIGNVPNPYEQAISIIGKTLSAFDDDNLIPCYGFGDASTHDQDVFSFYPDDKLCNGFEEVLERYREIVPCLRLAGPTSFAPIIEMAITVVEKSGGQYHVLLIIADGQVTRSVDTQNGQLSTQERKTVEAIVKASEYPLSIVLVGVGDGPWDMMKEFDDNIPARVFDNFQFVNFTEIMSKNVDPTKKETEFALAALMEIPSQYKATLEHGLLGNMPQRESSIEKVPLPPTRYASVSSISRRESNTSHSFQQRAPSYTNYNAEDTRPSSSSQQYDNKVCPICLVNPKDMAFGCGHQTCCECGEDLHVCPLCRSDISTRIKLY